MSETSYVILIVLTPQAAEMTQGRNFKRFLLHRVHHGHSIDLNFPECNEGITENMKTATVLQEMTRLLVLQISSESYLTYASLPTREP